MTWLGLLALACFATHAGYHIYHHHPEDLLWGCHVGTATIAVSLLFRSATGNAIGVLFLLLGVPLWLLDVATGGELMPTSVPTHLGGLTIGLLGVGALGMPRHAWWKASLAMIALVLLCRCVTPERANVNVAFHVQPGWEGLFPSHGWYLVMLTALSGVVFFVAELGLRRLGGPQP